MVKKLLKFFGFSLFFLFTLVAFMPKESFYFLFEKELAKFDVVISSEILDENLFSLGIQNLEISAKEVDTAVVQNAEITLLAFYNSVSLQNIELSSLVDAYVPSSIEHFKVSYTLLNPLVIYADALGEFGEASASFSILDRELQAVVKPSQRMLKEYKKSMRMLKKDENGEYVYAKTF